MNDLVIAVIMGIVEGLTEFLPVSSTGHLIVAETLLNFTGEKAKCFAIFIQSGAILAVVVLYWRRFMGLIPTGGSWFMERTGFHGFRGVALLALTTFPAVVAGLLTHRAIKEYLFNPKTVAWALAIGGIAILVVERFKPSARLNRLDDLGYGQALAVGLFQCIALWPGMSRAAATIIGGLLSGLDRRTATEYSFLAAVPVLVAATLYDLYKGWGFLASSDIALFAGGFLVSFLSAVLAVKTFIATVQRWSLAPYAVYRLVVAPIIYFTLT